MPLSIPHVHSQNFKNVLKKVYCDESTLLQTMPLCCYTKPLVFTVGKDAASGYIPSGSASSSSAPNTPVTHKKRKKRTQKSLTGSSSALSSLKQPSSHEQSNFEAPPSDGSCDNSYQIPMPATTGSGGCLVVKSDQSNSDDADYSRLEHSHPVTGSLTSNQVSPL